MDAKTRPRYEDFRVYETPHSLDDLHGPSSGSVTLPVGIFWAPGDKTVELVDDGRIDMVYRAVLSEGSAEDQCRFLNRNLLIGKWSELSLPIAVAKKWQEKFPELSGNLAAGLI